MSTNLRAKEFEVPYQIGTYDSEIIYSDKDGGWKGVKKRYILYLKREHQSDYKLYGHDRKKQKELDRQLERDIEQVESLKKITWWLL